MTTEQAPRQRGLRARVYEALPAGASPTNTACQPLHRHILDNAQGDIVALTVDKMREQFKDQQHEVITLREQDLDPATDGEVWALLQQTEGGVLVFGVTYSEDTPPAAQASTSPTIDSSESCPECGSSDAFEVQRATAPGPGVRVAVLIECRDCGAVWDSYVIH